MRRLALAAVLAMSVVPLASTAHAYVCNPLIEPVCYTICQIDRALGQTCPR